MVDSATQQLWQNALSEIKKKNINQALIQLEQINQQTEDPTVLMVTAQCLWKLGKYQLSTAFFKRCNTATNGSLESTITLIKALSAQAQNKQAQQYVNLALKTYPQDPVLLLYEVLLKKPVLDRFCINNRLLELYKQGACKGEVLNYVLAYHLFFSKENDKTQQLKLLSADSDPLKQSYAKIFKIKPDIDLISLPKDILSYALDQVSMEGIYIEAGVYYGMSINLLAQLRPSQLFYGFDSFQGLPESWNKRENAGSYSTDGNLPEVADNVELIHGWFSQTMPDFAKQKDQLIAFLHIDCDLYSSTKDVFSAFKHYIHIGTIILFDDFFGYPDFEKNEWRALDEFLAETGHQVDYLGFCVLGRELVVKITA